MKTLALITARGGSKGIPGKNTKLLGGKPLLHYTIDVAREFLSDEDICLSTDADYIIQCAEAAGLSVPFKRPQELASDSATSNDVIFHALDFYEKQGRHYDRLLLLQPTSPFRRKEHIAAALEAFDDATEMIVGVKETDANPYYVLFEEDAQGVLQKSKAASFTRRQDCPKVWQINGAIYLIAVNKLKERGDIVLLHKKKLLMDAVSSVDLDTPLDWDFAEFLLERKFHS